MAEKQLPTLQKQYVEEAVPGLIEHFKYKNRNQVPRLQRIVLNMGMGSAVGNPKVIDAAVLELAAIAGQKPVVTRAKKSIATFKLREGMRIGVMVTLRRDRMWQFMERLTMLALPRVRDFRGISPRAFDGAHTTRGQKPIMRFVNRIPAPLRRLLTIDQRMRWSRPAAQRCGTDNLPIATANLTPSIVMARHGRPNP